MSDEKIRPPAWWPKRERCAELLPEAIARTFPAEARERVTALLDRTYPLTREEARIGLALVFLSEGDERRLRTDLVDGLRDWRDIILAAENTRQNARRFFGWIEELDRA
ncbi:MAG TPA: hypothetical protein VEU77_00335 [Candidatus Acidoferrales bacterium]|nr:hypothetical protein [Candidatus Acidoferrales bacterium]